MHQIDVYACMISIHAPRVGCDYILLLFGAEHLISIHAPRVGCDAAVAVHDDGVGRFQSTHPGWGATLRFKHLVFEGKAMVEQVLAEGFAPLRGRERSYTEALLE